MSTLKQRVIDAVETANKRGYSVADIAKRCGISVQSIYQWLDPLNATKELKASSVLGLAELSGLNPWYLNDGVGEKKLYYAKNAPQSTAMHAREPEPQPYRVIDKTDPILEDLAVLDKYDAEAYQAKLESMKATIKSIEADIRSAAHKKRIQHEESNLKPDSAAQDSRSSHRRTA